LPRHDEFNSIEVFDSLNNNSNIDHPIVDEVSPQHESLNENISNDMYVYTRCGKGNHPCALNKFSQNIPLEEFQQKRSNQIYSAPNTFISYNRSFPNFRSCLITLHSYYEPSHYNDVKQYPNWNEPMKIELNTLWKANTWKIVDTPLGKKPILMLPKGKVFKVKTKSDESLE
jgi:hypothetical protein